MANYITIEKLYKLYIECNYLVTTDTRKLAANSMFFALKGDNFDANTFAAESIKQGCAYAIVDDEKYANNTTIFLVKNSLEALQQLAKHHRLQLTIPFIAITGSNGKTTNKELMHAVLSKKYKTLATKGNLNNHIGVPLTILSITPNYEIAIIEMGANHQGEIAFLCDITNPNFGIITNIGKAHLEGFGGEEGVKKGKGELFEFVKSKNETIFLNTDDAVVCDLAKGINAITYGEQNTNSVFAKQYQNSQFVEFKWATKLLTIENTDLVKTKLFGHYNYINALCAACVGNYFNVNATLINDALQNYLPEMNRSQVKTTPHNTLILDAYNANPSSMQLAIDNFCNQQLQTDKVIILGDMLELGEYANTEHQTILNQLQSLNQKNVFFVGPLFNALKLKHTYLHFFETVVDLIAYLKSNKISGKTILIKGSRGLKLETLELFL